MGLDGISINQLRVTPEFNSAELNVKSSSAVDEIKIVDGLSNGQRVDPDKEHEHENAQQDIDDEDSSDEENEENEEPDEVTKYDLSDAGKYIVRLDESTDRIQIVEKATKTVVQTVDADSLSKFVLYSSDSCGSIVNKKF